MSMRNNAEILNPCLKEQDLSYKCLSKNNYVQDKCVAYFENYNTCKKFWGNVYSDRKRKGLRPYLPEPEERERIKEDLKKSVKASMNEMSG